MTGKVSKIGWERVGFLMENYSCKANNKITVLAGGIPELSVKKLCFKYALLCMYKKHFF